MDENGILKYNMTDKTQLLQQNLMHLLKDGEKERVEFKLSFDKEAIETLCAFANTTGGRILLGVDNHGFVKGVELGRETLQNWNNQIKQSCSPSILPENEVVIHNDKQVVILSISEYPVKPVSCKGRYFKRLNNANHQMSITEISDLHLKTFNTSWDHYLDRQHKLDAISLDKVNEFIALSNKTRSYPLADPPLTVLRKYELLKEYDQITNGCYLLFTNDETMLTAIDLGRFSSATTIKDNLIARSDLFSNVNGVLSFLRKHLNKNYIISGEAQRTERWDYPMDALREIVINMIVHRDYTCASESSVKIFDNRIEFYNPGKLSGGLSVQQLISSNYTSSIRNKQIATIFKDAGLIERYGSGIKRVLESFALYGLQPPLFEELQEGFRVTVYMTTQKTTQKTTTKDKMLELLHADPNMTRADLALQLSKSENTIKEHLATLKSAGRLKRVGSDKGGYWMVIIDGK